MYSVYRTLAFMVEQGLSLPARIDFSFYVLPIDATYAAILTRVLDDADATLPPLGAPQSYAAAETYYFSDDTERHQFGQAFAMLTPAAPRIPLPFRAGEL